MKPPQSMSVRSLPTSSKFNGASKWMLPSAALKYADGVWKFAVKVRVLEGGVSDPRIGVQKGADF